MEIEVICSDTDQHRRRVESRVNDIDGLRLPGWDEVVRREYDTWDRERVVLDTATRTVEENIDAFLQLMRLQRGTP